MINGYSVLICDVCSVDLTNMAKERYEFDAPTHVFDFNQVQMTKEDDSWFGKMELYMLPCFADTNI